MKTKILTVAFFTILALAAFTSSGPKSSGNLGDIKYSALDSTEFRKQNGPGWIFMDGRGIQNTDIFKMGIMKEIPDGRGLFIRAMNVTRNDGKQDPFQQENNKTRLVGEFQGDAVQNHTHSCIYDMRGVCNNGNGDDGKLGRGMNSCWDRGNHGEINITGMNSGNTSNFETRPKNISLYLYIKVNN